MSSSASIDYSTQSYTRSIHRRLLAHLRPSLRAQKDDISNSRAVSSTAQRTRRTKGGELAAQVCRRPHPQRLPYPPGKRRPQRRRNSGRYARKPCRKGIRAVFRAGQAHVFGTTASSRVPRTWCTAKVITRYVSAKRGNMPRRFVCTRHFSQNTRLQSAEQR